MPSPQQHQQQQHQQQNQSNRTRPSSAALPEFSIGTSAPSAVTFAIAGTGNQEKPLVDREGEDGSGKGTAAATTTTTTASTSAAPLQIQASGSNSPASANRITLLQRQASAATAASTGALHHAKDRQPASSDELIHNLERKVRRIVDLKRSESDKLKYLVAKKKEEITKSRLILQDLIKNSNAIGVRVLSPGKASSPALSTNQAASQQQQQQVHLQSPVPVQQQQQPPPPQPQQSQAPPLGDTHADTSHRTQMPLHQPLFEDNGVCVIQHDPFEAITSISRRPVYAKHSNINELEKRLERRALEAQEVQRKTLTYEHIKKRLLGDYTELIQATNLLKQQLEDKQSKTQELHKADISAAEAVNHVQSRVFHLKQDIAYEARQFRREMALRNKWAKEKTKFEKYYQEQLNAIRQSQLEGSKPVVEDDHHPHHNYSQHATASSTTSTGRKKTGLGAQLIETDDELRHEERIRQAFHQLGIGIHKEKLDPEEVVRLWLSHEELSRELDAKREETLEKITHCRGKLTLSKAASAKTVAPTLTRRTTKKHLEGREGEVAILERSLSTVVDQYMFVEQTVRPVKIGLQQIIQNLTNQCVNIDDFEELEKGVLHACEELMHTLKEFKREEKITSAASSASSSSASFGGDPNGVKNNNVVDPLSEGAPSNHAMGQQVESSHHQHQQVSVENTALGLANDKAFVDDPTDVGNLTSPFNIRVKAKTRDYYNVPGIILGLHPAAKDEPHETTGEEDSTVMDRLTVKRLAATASCAVVIKKPKDKKTQQQFH